MGLETHRHSFPVWNIINDLHKNTTRATASAQTKAPGSFGLAGPVQSKPVEALALQTKSFHLAGWNVRTITTRTLQQYGMGITYNLAMLMVYAPTIDVDDATKDEFYLDVQRLINQIRRSDLLIISETWTAQPDLPDNTTRLCFDKILGRR